MNRLIALCFISLILAFAAGLAFPAHASSSCPHGSNKQLGYDALLANFDRIVFPTAEHIKAASHLLALKRKDCAEGAARAEEEDEAGYTLVPVSGPVPATCVGRRGRYLTPEELNMTSFERAEAATARSHCTREDFYSSSDQAQIDAYKAHKAKVDARQAKPAISLIDGPDKYSKLSTMSAEDAAWHKEQKAKAAEARGLQAWHHALAIEGDKATQIAAYKERAAKRTAEIMEEHGEELEANAHGMSIGEWNDRRRHSLGIAFGFAPGSKTRVYDRDDYQGAISCPNTPKYDRGSTDSLDDNKWICETGTFVNAGVAAHYEYNHTGFDTIGVRVADAPAFRSLAVNYKFSAPVRTYGAIMHPYAYAGLGLVSWKARQGKGESNIGLTWGIGLDFPVHGNTTIRFGWASSEVRGKDNPPRALEIRAHLQLLGDWRMSSRGLRADHHRTIPRLSPLVYRGMLLRSACHTTAASKGHGH